MSRQRQAPADLELRHGLSGIRKFRSPAIGTLLTLAILLGKIVACQHAPGRTVFFDVMLMVPVSMLAYQEGLVTGLVAGLLATLTDAIMTAKVSGVLLPAYLASGALRTSVVPRLFTLEVLAGIIAAVSHRSRRAAILAERRTEEHLKKICLLERHTEAIERDARTRQAQFEQSLLKYSSLLYLLEESAQKIYSNLEVDRLFQSLFRVLEECFGSTCASLYLRDGRNGSYLLASAFGADQRPADSIPMMLRPDDFQVKELEHARRAVCWADERYMQAFQGKPPTIPAVISGTLLDKGEVVGLVNVHAVSRPGLPDVNLMGMVSNIASIALANARLFGEVQWMADRDPLTRLYNRRTFHKQIETHIAARTANSESFSLLMLDIDHFKAFNDTYGHQAGDAVLEWFAAHCEECAGAGDPVFRYGGEEFTVIMPGADAEAGRRLAERIRQRVEQATFRCGTDELKVTLSCGVAVFPDNGLDGDELVRRADRALYKAKGLGRNAVVVSETGPGHDTAIVPYEIRKATTVRGGRGHQAPGVPGGMPAAVRQHKPVL